MVIKYSGGLINFNYVVIGMVEGKVVVGVGLHDAGVCAEGGRSRHVHAGSLHQLPFLQQIEGTSRAQDPRDQGLYRTQCLTGTGVEGVALA